MKRNNKLNEATLSVKQYVSERDKSLEAKNKILIEIDETNSRIKKRTKTISEKFRAAKKSMQELVFLNELDQMERNLDNDDFMRERAKTISQLEKIEEQPDQEEDKEDRKQEEDSEDRDEEEDEGNLDQDMDSGEEQINSSSKRQRVNWEYYLREDLKDSDLKLKFSSCENLSEDYDDICNKITEVEEEIESLDQNHAIITEFKNQMNLFQK
jgi:hypothetical protein